jgi:hypothetical protein
LEKLSTDGVKNVTHRYADAQAKLNFCGSAANPFERQRLLFKLRLSYIFLCPFASMQKDQKIKANPMPPAVLPCQRLPLCCSAYLDCARRQINPWTNFSTVRVILSSPPHVG